MTLESFPAAATVPSATFIGEEMEMVTVGPPPATADEAIAHALKWLDAFEFVPFFEDWQAGEDMARWMLVNKARWLEVNGSVSAATA